ncbi:MAG: MBOAT family protein [Candidatus Binatia bacterium]
MPIVSIPFAAFAVLALAVYHLLPHQRARQHWLLLASYTFYALESWRFLPVLLLLTGVTFAVAGQLLRRTHHRAVWLWIGLGANVAALGAFRYAYPSNPFTEPFLVVGLSFYTLQGMSYLLDAHAGTLKTPHRLADVALYLAYFPKLVAGPIERAREFLPQLAHAHVVDDATAGRAGTLIAVGVTRKLVIADPLAALLPAEAFSAPSQLGAAALAAAIAGYAFVLYNDFAGYTNIARGVSSLFGIELSANFAQPFFARSFTEFWTRWHITLSRWLRDYIYMPLSRALLRRNPRRSNVPGLLLPPMVTMLAGGLWHGNSAGMLLWGGMHGAYLICERILTLRPRASRAGVQPMSRQVLSALAVFALGCWALVAFRTTGAVALEYWGAMLRGAAGDLPDPQILAFMAASLWLDWREHRYGAETMFDHWPRFDRAALLAAAMLLWFVMTRIEPTTPFIYRGF